MLNIFYKVNGKILVSQSETDFVSIKRESVLWIDLLAPSGEEKHATEAFLGTDIQTRAQAEEIESSSRFRETDKVIFANTNFLMPGPEEYTEEAVSFTLVGNTLTTLREVPLRSFTELQRRIEAMPKQYKYSRRINQKEDINEEFLLDINQLQENTMIIRENVVDKQRLISNLLKSNKYPKDLEPRFNVLLQDIASLISHANFSFERLEYLQDTVVGLINLEQNSIMKIFTLVSLLLMPPTLVASFYGMNVKLPLAGLPWAWLVIVGVMILSLVIILFVFIRRKML